MMAALLAALTVRWCATPSRGLAAAKIAPACAVVMWLVWRARFGDGEDGGQKSETRCQGGAELARHAHHACRRVRAERNYWYALIRRPKPRPSRAPHVDQQLALVAEGGEVLDGAHVLKDQHVGALSQLVQRAHGPRVACGAAGGRGRGVVKAGRQRGRQAEGRYPSKGARRARGATLHKNAPAACSEAAQQRKLYCITIYVSISTYMYLICVCVCVYVSDLCALRAPE